MAALEKGDAGDTVKSLQRDLNLLGSMLTIDGDFGSSTEAAVVDARAVLKLSASLVADDELIGRLRRSRSRPRS